MHLKPDIQHSDPTQDRLRLEPRHTRAGLLGSNVGDTALGRVWCGCGLGRFPSNVWCKFLNTLSRLYYWALWSCWVSRCLGFVTGSALRQENLLIGPLIFNTYPVEAKVVQGRQKSARRVLNRDMVRRGALCYRTLVCGCTSSRV